MRAWIVLETGLAERKSPIAYDLMPQPRALARRLKRQSLRPLSSGDVPYHRGTSPSLFLLSTLPSHTQRLCYHPGYQTIASNFVFQRETFIDEREMSRTVKGEFRIDLVTERFVFRAHSVYKTQFARKDAQGD